MNGARNWRRIVLWAVLVVVITMVVLAAATFVWLNVLLARTHENEQDAAAIDQAMTEALPDGEEVPPEPGTTNILVLGSDKREDESEQYGRSDTLMIVHVDPVKDFVSVMSLPRDLRVDMGNHGHQKMNAAYAYGGVPLTITTVRQLTGLTIDKYVHVDFDAFRRLTEAFGGVYVDVDRRYYYAGPDYERVDVQPGYQRLVGDDALQYVRFRHDQNGDYGRIERQQQFVRGAKGQAIGWGTAGRFKEMVEVLAGNIGTDLSGFDITKLAWWGVRLESGRIKQVSLPGTDDYIEGVSYVLVDDTGMANAVQDLLTPPAPPATTGTTKAPTGTTVTTKPPTTSTTELGQGGTPAQPIDLNGVSVGVWNAGGRKGEAAAVSEILQTHGARIRDVSSADKPVGRSVVLYPAGLQAEGGQVALALGIRKMFEDNSRRNINVVIGDDFLMPAESPPPGPNPGVVDGNQWAAMARAASFPVMAPKTIPKDYSFAGYRLYDMDTEKGPRPSLKVMYRYQREDEFFGFMETTFLEAPAAEAGEKVEAGGHALTVVSLGDKVDHIWWKDGKTLYWVSNTLSHSLSRAQLLAVAESMIPIE